jgi:hypothetical protein
MNRYRVISEITTVYGLPRRWRMLRTLSIGELWEGEPVEGQNWRHNRVWIKGYDGYVWSGALEEIKEEVQS